MCAVLKLLKRIEVRLLLLLVIVGLALLAYKRWGRFHGEASDAPFEITKVELQRDHGFGVLSLTIDYDNRDGTEDVTAVSGPAEGPATARLVTASGRVPSHFFLGGEFPPVFKAGERTTETVRYWIERSDLEHALYFESGPDRVIVKNDAPIALDEIENQKTVTFDSPEWKL